MSGRFDGKVVLLTGATGGFGRLTAGRLAEAGAKLVLSDLTETLPDDMRALPGDPVYVTADIADESTGVRLVEACVNAFGRIDIAINNAGIAHDPKKLHQIAPDEARRIIDIDLMGVLYAMQAELRQMEKQFRETGSGGAIVNIASVAGLGGAPRLGAYAAAKHGVVGLTRTAALEYASKGIRVNAICPSYARTPMAGMLLDRYPQEDRAAAEADMARGIPMKRLAEAGEVVEAILFAADPANSFMTGQCLAVDGGLQAL